MTHSVNNVTVTQPLKIPRMNEKRDQLLHLAYYQFVKWSEQLDENNLTKKYQHYKIVQYHPATDQNIMPLCFRDIVSQ